MGASIEDRHELLVAQLVRGIDNDDDRLHSVAVLSDQARNLASFAGQRLRGEAPTVRPGPWLGFSQLCVTSFILPVRCRPALLDCEQE